jgi:antitoxin ChpS
MKTLEEILRPPTEEEVAEAIARFAGDLRRHYGDRIQGLYLFGSRARGDHGPHSDADVAVVLDDRAWDFRREKHAVTDIATEVIVDTGVHVQGWPVSRSAWDDPAKHTNPLLVKNMHRDARPIGQRA